MRPRGAAAHAECMSTAHDREQMADADAEWLAAAREFVVTIDGHAVVITRYDNHRRPIPDGGWVAMFPLGPLNPWYAVQVDGRWTARYKNYTPLPTFQQAHRAASRALRHMIDTGQWTAQA